MCFRCRDFTCEYEVVLRRELRSTAAFFVRSSIKRTIDIAALRVGVLGMMRSRVEERGGEEGISFAMMLVKVFVTTSL